MARNSRPLLLAGCALGALLVSLPTAASAQSFDGTPEVVTGDALVTTMPDGGEGLPARTDVLVFTPETVINWYTFDFTPGTPINFQPEGTVAAFASQVGDFTVLNRILPLNGNSEPTDAIVALNGIVQGSTGNGFGGNIWFYSPTGIVAGPTALFNVGSLVLTTNDVQFTENCGPCETYGTIYQPGGVVQFRGPGDSLGSVEISAGARINALGPNGYVAVVAPRIVQAGTVTAEGNIAYIAAEQADVTINAGLFNFELLVGTTDPQGVVHTGTSTGPASTDYYSDPQTITVAAVSKNTALTMLLSGSLGYTPAANAFSDGSSVVLRAGNSSSPADGIRIGDAIIGNRLEAYATGDITVAPTAGSPVTGDPGGTTTFADYANLFADRSVTVLADHGSTITALDSLNLASYDDFGAAGSVIVEARGANGLSGPGSISVTGGLQASASGYGFTPVEGQFGGDAQGGTVELKANGGTIAADYLSLDANGYGGEGELLGGNGTGGSVLLSAGYGGSITSQSTDLYAVGQGGGIYGDEGFGGIGRGGDIEMTDAGTDFGVDAVGGRLALGFLNLNASADGGYSSEFGSGRAGDAFGGTIDVLLSRQNQSFDSLYGTVNAHDGDTALDPLAGTIDMVIGGGITVDMPGDLILTANALSGVNGGPLASGTGGTVNLTVEAASTLSIGGSFYGEARADVADPFGGVTIDSTPTLTGGTVDVLADGGAFSASNFVVDVSAANIAAATFAGPATGGTASVGANNGGSISVGGIQGFSGQLTIRANAYGPAGPAVPDGVGGEVSLFANNGGAVSALGATVLLDASARIGSQRNPLGQDVSPTQLGGSVSISADGGNITAAGLDARAEAEGTWADSTAGDARGGSVTMTARNGANILFDNGVGTALAVLSANALGTPGPVAANASGGTAMLIAEDGAITVPGDIVLSASGLSTAYSTPPPDGPGFAATGGDAGVELLAGTLGTASVSTNSLSVLANGDAQLNISMFNGEGVPPTIVAVPIAGDGGAGAGGTAGLSVDAGNLTVQSLSLESNGVGGTSAAASGSTAFQSGSGTGGTSRFVQSGGTIDIPALALLTNGVGGGGAPTAAEGSELTALAGMGSGGEATLALSGGAALRVTDLTFEANGIGGDGMNHIDDGDGSDGGTGVGGTAALQAAAGWTGSLAIPQLLLQANGVGGLGGVSDPNGASPALGTSGNGGDGRGGDTIIDLADGALTLGPVRLEANGNGGDGFNGGNGSGGLARFAVVDSAVGPASTRSIASLFVDASGLAGNASGGPGATSFAGSAEVTAAVLDADAALAIGGELSVFATGGQASPVSGIDVMVSGAPLTASGQVTMVATGDLSIGAAAPLHGLLDVVLEGRSVTTTGLVRAGGALEVTGFDGISADRLTAGGTTLLGAVNGPIVVDDLLSAGQVTASGRSLEVHSSGALDFLQAVATSGNLWIETELDLDVAALSATGSVMLESNAGNIATGNFTAGTFAYVDAFGRATLGDVAAANDVVVATRGGALTVGNVTAGDDIWLGVLGSNPAALLSAGNLVSTGLGADDADGPTELFGGPGPAGNLIAVRSSGSLAVGDVGTSGRAFLVADAGTAAAGEAVADEALVVFGHGDISLEAVATSGRLLVADSSMFTAGLAESYDPAALDGTVPVRTGGNLAIGSAVDAGQVTIAVGGNANAPSWTSAGSMLIDAGGQFASTVTVTAGGDASITADGGIDLAALTSGGTTLLRSTAGAIDVANLHSNGAVTARGRSIAIGSTEALSFADLDATAGAIAVTTAGNLAFVTADATGGVTLRSTGGSIAGTGAVNSGGNAVVEAPGGVTLPALTSGGTTRLASSGGPVDIGALVSTGTVAASGRSVAIVGSGPLTFTTAEALNTLSVITDGDLAFASVRSGLDLTLRSTAGSLTATGDVSGLYGNLAAEGDIALHGNLTSGGNLLVRAGGSFTVEGDTSTGDANIAADRGIALASLTSGEITGLEAVSGTIVIPELLTGGRVSARGLGVDIASSGSLYFGDATATQDDLRIRTAGHLTADSLLAESAMNLTSGGTFSLRGEASAATIDVRSSDIAIDGEVGQLGVREVTSAITLTNRSPGNQTYVGDGAADEGAYVLDGGEARRLFADESIFIGVVGEIGPDEGIVEIGDLAMGFGGNIGAGGLLEISTPGEVHITGEVALNTTGADDTFRIDPRLIALDTDTGSISLFAGEGGAGGTAQGRLEMIADTVAVATGGVLGQLETVTDLTAITALLNQPGGTPDPLTAGTIDVEVTDGFYIQNSGASAEFATRLGFTAGALNIATGSSTTHIAVNGRIITPAGPVTGLATAPLMRINGAVPAAGGQFDPRSSINGCVIGSNCAFVPEPEPEPEIPDFTPPTNEDIESPIPPAAGPGSLFVAPLIELAGTDPLITPPLVDEPITGVGNDDLWEPRCDPTDENSACPEGDSQP